MFFHFPIKNSEKTIKKTVATRDDHRKVNWKVRRFAVSCFLPYCRKEQLISQCLLFAKKRISRLLHLYCSKLNSLFIYVHTYVCLIFCKKANMEAETNGSCTPFCFVCKLIHMYVWRTLCCLCTFTHVHASTIYCLAVHFFGTACAAIWA